MLHRYKAWNFAMPTTAAPAGVTTGTAIKTMLQLATPATRMIMPLAWGFTIDDPPGADGVIELIQTDVAATVTAHVAAGVPPLDANAPASMLTLGVAATGYTATAEGAITATRVLDVVSLSSVSAEAAPLLTYRNKFDEGEDWIIPVSKFLRVRATTPTTAVDM
ncbi:MAG: hypothetical protein L0Y54_16395, partial [Sporichthyaceae bacterium]|nr:hypothetical protein [Sporichthyaceae bacterium]